MLPDFPLNVRINWDSQRQGATKKISIRPILFIYYEKSLVSSNLNSKQLRFHGVRPNVGCTLYYILVYIPMLDYIAHDQSLLCASFRYTYYIWYVHYSYVDFTYASYTPWIKYIGCIYFLLSGQINWMNLHVYSICRYIPFL